MRLCGSAKNSQCRVFVILLNPAPPHVFRTMQRWLFAHTTNLIYWCVYKYKAVFYLGGLFRRLLLCSCGSWTNFILLPQIKKEKKKKNRNPTSCQSSECQLLQAAVPLLLCLYNLDRRLNRLRDLMTVQLLFSLLKRRGGGGLGGGFPWGSPWIDVRQNIRGWICFPSSASPQSSPLSLFSPDETQTGRTQRQRNNPLFRLLKGRAVINYF